jgi:peptidoglycan/xylan/chitin deacetylase (PgdA/CDA1 family)
MQAAMGTAARLLQRRSLGAVRRLGGYRVLGASRWRRERLLILCYHGISIDDEHLWNGELYMPPDRLEGRLRALRASGCHVLPLGEALERLGRGDLPDRSVAITFDDGFHDFLSRAYPLLAEYGMPATVYLTTLRAQHSTPVFRLICSYMLWKGRAGAVTLPDLGREQFDLRTASGRGNMLNAIERITQGERMSLCDKDAFAERLAERLGVDYAMLRGRRQLCIMTPADVSQLAARGVDFQLHTHTHQTRRERVAFQRDIEINRTAIEGWTGRPATHFCYPSGIYQTPALEWLHELGVVSATTCDPGLASRASHPLLLPRLIDTSYLSDVAFEGWIAGIASLLRSGRHQAAHVNWSATKESTP